MTNSKGKIMQLDDYQRRLAKMVVDGEKSKAEVAKQYNHGWATIDKWVSALMEERAAAEHYEKVMEHAMEVDPEVISDEYTSIVLDGGRHSEPAVGNITFGPNRVDPHDSAKDALDKFTAQLKESIERTKTHSEVLANLMEQNDQRKKESEQLEEMRNQREVLADLMERQSKDSKPAKPRYPIYMGHVGQKENERKIEALEQEVAMLKRLVSEMHEVNGVLINLIEMR